MILDIIFFSVLIATFSFFIMFFICYSAIFNRNEYEIIIELYNHIFKEKNDIQPIEISTFKSGVYKKFKYGEYHLIYWGNDDVWSMHDGSNCIVCSFCNNRYSGIVTSYMYKKINKYLREKV